MELGDIDDGNYDVHDNATLMMILMMTMMMTMMMTKMMMMTVMIMMAVK